MKSSTLSTVAATKASYPSYSVITTGHSLGGAIATLAGAYLRVNGVACDIYTYGSPRVGNDDFVNFVDGQSGSEYRVTHVDDPIPRLPGSLLGYRHTNVEYWLATGGDTTTSYAATDIDVCTGIKNLDCNGGETGLSLTPHSYYFQDIGACK
jgi:predicted lipase